MKIQRLKDGRLRDAGTGKVIGHVNDRNPIDENLSMAQMIVNRLERRGETYDFGPLADDLMKSSLNLKKMIAQKNKNGALKEFSNNVRILRKIQGTPTIAKPLREKAKEMLGKMGVVEKEIKAIP